MGRQEEIVLAEASPLENNIVTLKEYDTFGRLEKQWLQAETWVGGCGAYVSPETLKQNIRIANCKDSVPVSYTHLNEVADLVAKGYKEVTLLGQNVNSYRFEKPTGETVTFPMLLRTVAVSYTHLDVYKRQLLWLADLHVTVIYSKNILL